jgi:hypothetical protein
MTTKKSQTSHNSEVRIAITYVSGDLTFECPLSPADIRAAVATALSSGKPLELTDIRGHEIIVPADKIAFVEVGNPAARRVGFGAL